MLLLLLFSFGLSPKGVARVCCRCFKTDVPFRNVHSCSAYLHRTKKVTVLS